MRFKVLLAVIALAFTSISTAVAKDGEYTLTYKLENKWVAQEDLTPLKQAIAFFGNNDLKIKATCSESDKFCKQRVEIINHIFKKQKVKQPVSIIETAKLDKNTLILDSVDLDFNKYSNLFINYTNKSIVPVKQSVTDFTKLLKKSELKYLSQFKMYCKNVDQLCKDRFNHLSNIIGKTLTFKYNFALYENANLDDNVAQIVNHRHDYNINNPIAKPKTTAAIEKKKQEAKKQTKPVIKYTNKANIIVFAKDSKVLENSEKVKIENLIINSKDNKFNFTCNLSNSDLCKQRVRVIKDYALRNTSNIIEMYQIEKSTLANYIIINHK
jgi:hypothetical protein